VVEVDTAVTFPSPATATLGANATAYQSTGRAPSTTYYYRVKATNGFGSSGYSNVAGATTAPSAYVTSVLADGPAGYWRLGETSGTTAVDQRGANNGAYGGGPTLGAASLLPQDTSNKAVSFDGSNDTVSIPNAAALGLTAAVTVEAWIKPSAIPALGSFSSVVTKAESYSLQFNGPRFEFTIIQNGVRRRLQAAAGAIQAGTTCYVVGTYDGGTQRLYVNGSELVNAALSGAISPAATPLTIGSWGSAEYFTGTIDEAAVYPTALSAARVSAHYAAGR